MEKVTWKNGTKMCKCWLELGPPEFKTQAERVANCLDLQWIIKMHLIAREALRKMGGRSTLQRCLKRTRWL